MIRFLEARSAISTAVVLLMMVASVPVPATAEPGVPTGNYVAHPQIRIQTDADFTAENGVVGGSGTWGDPYRISGWHIVPEQGSFREYIAIGIGAGVTESYFVIENNFLELKEDSTVGVSLGTAVPGLVTTNTIAATGLGTFGVVVGPGERQDPLDPLRIHENVFLGVRGTWQVGLWNSGTAVEITHNQFVDLDFAVRGSGAQPEGPQFLTLHHNDFVGVNWGIWAHHTQPILGNTPIMDARDNYWGNPNGPTTSICLDPVACEVDPLGTHGARIPPHVLGHPYAKDPFDGS